MPPKRGQDKKSLFTIIEEAELARKLVKETHFTDREVQSLIKIYKKFQKGHVMDKQRFIELLHNSLGMTDEFFMERVFYACDADKDGIISLAEFIRSLSVMLRGTLKEKIPFCFAAFDIKDNTQLSREDICTLLVQSVVQQAPDEDPAERILDIVEIFLKKMVKNNEGILTFENYKTAVEEDPMLLEVFGPVLPDDKSRVAFLAMFSENHPLLGQR